MAKAGTAFVKHRIALLAPELKCLVLFVLCLWVLLKSIPPCLRKVVQIFRKIAQKITGKGTPPSKGAQSSEATGRPPPYAPHIPPFRADAPSSTAFEDLTPPPPPYSPTDPLDSRSPRTQPEQPPARRKTLGSSLCTLMYDILHCVWSLIRCVCEAFVLWLRVVEVLQPIHWCNAVIRHLRGDYDDDRRPTRRERSPQAEEPGLPESITQTRRRNSC